MKNALGAGALGLLLTAMLSLPPPVLAADRSAGEAVPQMEPVRFSIVKTSGAKTLEAMTWSGGSWFKSVQLDHMAVLVQHGEDMFLFDAGLGRDIDTQYKAEMPWWMKPSFSYEQATPARDQLDAAGIGPLRQVVLSHVHWDHGSGVHDFPEAEIWALADDRHYIPVAPVGPVLPSQFVEPDVNWRDLDISGPEYRGYPHSLDWYGDGSVVFVAMPGHTPGSIGMFVSTASGRTFLFCGDVVWRAAAIADARPKFFFASVIADADRAGTLTEIRRLSKLAQQYPTLEIVPAHDASVHDALGYFPQWVE